jgi:TolA-binding protein
MLIVTELQALERLFDTTPRSSPDRPSIALRMAEAYVELASAAARDKAAERTAQEVRKAQATERAARARAVKLYQLVANQYPRWCAPAAGSVSGDTNGDRCVDEVLYFLGYELELAGEIDAARKVYLDLVKRFPESRYVPYVYFAFAEIFLEQARSDPGRWQLAARLYEKASTFRESPIAPHAVSRLDLVCERTGGRPGPPGRCTGGSLRNVQVAGDAGENAGGT